jgi:hypothetical protein
MVWDVIENKTARYFLNLENSFDKESAKNKGVTGIPRSSEVPRSRAAGHLILQKTFLPLDGGGLRWG